MVFIGGWRPRRRRYGDYGTPNHGNPGHGNPGYGNPGYGNPGYGNPGYGAPGYGGYRGNSCMRDLCLLQTGCCLAEMIGCGPQLTLLGPSLARRSFRAAAAATRSGEAIGARAWTLLFLLAAIRLYQLEISSKRHACCRYTPSCSHYAAEALDQHGLRHGLWLTARRLLRCRPGTTGGSDPVPAGA